VAGTGGLPQFSGLEPLPTISHEMLAFLTAGGQSSRGEASSVKITELTFRPGATKCLLSTACRGEGGEFSENHQTQLWSLFACSGCVLPTCGHWSFCWHVCVRDASVRTRACGCAVAAVTVCSASGSTCATHVRLLVSHTLHVRSLTVLLARLGL